MGGTLLITRKIKLHDYFIGKLEAKGFCNVTATAVERNGLSMVINDICPRTILIDVEFYKSASCYMIRDLVKKYKNITFVVVSLMEFPADLGMWLIINGVKSYLNFIEGDKQFVHGLECVRDGKTFISADVQQRFNCRDNLPLPATDITDREYEIWRLICNGFIEQEIANDLNLSMPTIKFHKTKLLNNLGIRNDKEAIKVARYLKLFTDDELNFYGGMYGIRPETNTDKRNRRKRK